VKITAQQRIGEQNFPECIRQTLLRHYGGKLVTFSGIFLIEDGNVLIHVMPDFPDKDFFSRDEVKVAYSQTGLPLFSASK
jgi:hypothetical protein